VPANKDEMKFFCCCEKFCRNQRWEVTFHPTVTPVFYEIMIENIPPGARLFAFFQ
jgi:hypothetical protein